MAEASLEPMPTRLCTARSPRCGFGLLLFLCTEYPVLYSTVPVVLYPIVQGIAFCFSSSCACSNFRSGPLSSPVPGILLTNIILDLDRLVLCLLHLLHYYNGMSATDAFALSSSLIHPSHLEHCACSQLYSILSRCSSSTITAQQSLFALDLALFLFLPLLLFRAP